MNLVPYLLNLVRWWPLLAAGALLGGGAALGVAMLQPPTYEAVATILVTRPRYQIQFDPRFSTLVNPQSPLTIPSKAYISLARTNEIEREVREALASELDAAERRPGALLDRIKVEQAGGSRGDPNVFEIRAQASDPRKAQRLANAWATTYVRLATELYGQSGETRAYLANELKAATEQLQAAEDGLIEFQRRSTIPVLQQQIDATQKSLAAYLTANATALPEVVSAQVAAQIKQLNDVLAELNNVRKSRLTITAGLPEAPAGQLAAQVSRYNALLAARNNLRTVRRDAEALREQILDGPAGAPAGTALAGLLLQIQSLNSGSRAPVELQIPIPEPLIAADRDGQIRELAALIRALADQETALTREADQAARDLEEQKTSILNAQEARLTSRVDELLSQLAEGRAVKLGAEPGDTGPVAVLIGQTTRELQELQAQLQAQQNELDQRTRARDLAKTTYTSLANKAEEVRIEAAIQLREVQIASLAEQTERPVTAQRPAVIALIGAVVGLLAVGLGTALQLGFAGLGAGRGLSLPQGAANADTEIRRRPAVEAPDG